MIFAIVAAAILYSVWRFRVHPDDDRDGPPIHGNTTLEIVWTAVPTALVTAIAIVSAIVLHDNGDFGKNPLRVRVTAEQFTWVFTYENGPAKGVVSPDLYLPVDKVAKLEIETRDVLHSFWVPEFGQKQDAVPGRINPLKVTPTKVTGNDRKKAYPVICTELCGLGHALMRRYAYVLTAADFTAWAQKQKGPTGPTGPAGPASGKTIFTSNGCNSCHTLTAAGAKGTVGPDLDKLPAEAQKAGQPLEQFIRTSIVDPNAYIEPKCPNGACPKGVMPPDFGQKISKPDLDTLVQYLIQSSKGGGK